MLSALGRRYGRANRGRNAYLVVTEVGELVPDARQTETSQQASALESAKWRTQAHNTRQTRGRELKGRGVTGARGRADAVVSERIETGRIFTGEKDNYRAMGSRTTRGTLGGHTIVATRAGPVQEGHKRRRDGLVWRRDVNVSVMRDVALGRVLEDGMVNLVKQVARVHCPGGGVENGWDPCVAARLRGCLVRGGRRETCKRGNRAGIVK
ncbi:hypothetical protein BC628DRAFT_1018888 [Trametes gibbosa]|nr:hypothetical protein BC628DRAFT_1018888 [Trametes gibbosa]